MFAIPWIEINMPFGWPRENKIPFKDQHICKPGVQIELEDGERYLIGDINQMGGKCNCCEIEGSAIVKKYRVLIDFSE